MSTVQQPPDAQQRQWFIVGRWQEFEGEARANLLRIFAVGSFYIVELLNYHGLDLGWLQIDKTVDLKLHQQLTALAVAWTLMAMATHICLQRRIFPAALKYLTTAGDLLLLTAMLMAAGGPRSPLVAVYFLIIPLSALRFSLSLVRAATAGAALGYLCVLGHARWFAADPDRLVPRYHQLIVLLAIGFCGLILGQVIRRVRQLAEQYARRMATIEKNSS